MYPSRRSPVPFPSVSSSLSELFTLFSKPSNASLNKECVPIDENDERTYKRIETSPQSVADLPNINYGILGQDQDQDFWIIVKERESVSPLNIIPMGKYDFVKILNGEIRIVESDEKKGPQHFSLAEGAEVVLYAGQIHFDFDIEGSHKIAAWNNYAPAYITPGEFMTRTGKDAADFTPFADEPKNLENESTAAFEF